MATQEYNDPRLNAPPDLDAERRAQRLADLDLGQRPDAEFDALAARIAHATGVPFAMVNFLTADQQYFSGLHTPSAALIGAAESAQNSEFQALSRNMALDHGYCPHVVERRLPLVLDDVCDYPRYAGNPVVDKLGVTSYLGAPLIDPVTGIILGTVCALSTEHRSWGRPGLATIKTLAGEAVALIDRRDRQRRILRP